MSLAGCNGPDGWFCFSKGISRTCGILLVRDGSFSRMVYALQVRYERGSSQIDRKLSAMVMFSVVGA
jgi:hypothetical protein